MKLFCALCKEDKEESEFTPFERNPSLADRNGRVCFCRSCCAKFVEERGNSKASLKELLRMIDVPYIEKYAQSALENYEKKRKGTNIIIKRNVYDDMEEISDVENSKLQSTIYTCYCSRLGVIPKSYINHSFSDGFRKEDTVNTTETQKQPVQDDEKEIQSAIRFLKKSFGDDIYEDKNRLAKAVKVMVDECSLHKNNNKKRQDKFRLKKQVQLLIDSNILDSALYDFLNEDDKKQTAKVVENTYDGEDIEIPEDVDMDDMITKWGLGYKDSELLMFERKYKELRRNYEIKTASHDEFLKLAVVSVVKGQMAMARNDIENAEKWMRIFKDMTSAGKLQPQQMSKADLSGGLNNFSEYYKSVENAKGIIEILPEFKKKPKDDPDFVIFCLIQYVRRLKGMPDCKYEDIWEFYEELARSNIEHLE